MPLLALPAALLLLWCWQLWRRRRDAQAFMRRRNVPVEERIPFFGELLLLPRRDLDLVAGCQFVNQHFQLAAQFLNRQFGGGARFHHFQHAAAQLGQGVFHPADLIGLVSG